MFVRALNATAKNTVISPYFPRVEILWKDTVSVKFGQISQNYVEVVSFHKISTPGN